MRKETIYRLRMTLSALVFLATITVLVRFVDQMSCGAFVISVPGWFLAMALFPTPPEVP